MIRNPSNDTRATETARQEPDACPDAAPLTVYFDGSCPLCRLEIDHYAAQSDRNELAFVDVAATQTDTGPDLVKAAAMARFHVRRPDGDLVSGAAAFVEIWQRLPRWRFAARLARLPGAIAAMEILYRLFLPARPFLSGCVGWWQQRQQGRQR